jgi:hypothetical protein
MITPSCIYIFTPSCLFGEMKEDNIFDEEALLPDSINKLVMMLKEAMNGASEEAYKGLIFLIKYPILRKEFTEEEIQDYYSSIADDTEVEFDMDKLEALNDFVSGDLKGRFDCEHENRDDFEE